jgi:hypothetical protein
VRGQAGAGHTEGGRRRTQREHLSQLGNGSRQARSQPDEAVTGTGGRGATALTSKRLSLTLCGESQEALENQPGDNGGGGGVALYSHRT